MENGSNKTGTKEAENILKKIETAALDGFTIFDHDNNKTVNKTEVGAVVRSLSLCPTEGELHDLVTEMEDDHGEGEFIRYEKYLPVVTKCIMERRYMPFPEARILKAFEALDQEKKGFLTKEELSNILMTEGEPFSQDEMETMVNSFLDPETGKIDYKRDAHLLVCDGGPLL